MAGLPQQMTLVGEKMVFILDSHRWERGLFVVGAPAALLVFCPSHAWKLCSCLSVPERVWCFHSCHQCSCPFTVFRGPGPSLQAHQSFLYQFKSYFCPDTLRPQPSRRRVICSSLSWIPGNGLCHLFSCGLFLSKNIVSQVNYKIHSSKDSTLFLPHLSSINRIWFGRRTPQFSILKFRN